MGYESVTSHSPPEVARIYNFPTRLDGSGQRIAVIELGGGYRLAEMQAYFKGLDLPMPRITDVSVNGVVNSPGAGGPDSEVALDVQVIGAIVPGAELLVYFSTPDERGMIDAVNKAVFDGREPTVISISFGAQEDSFTDQAREALDQAFRAAAALGITVCAASGDYGYSDMDGMGSVRVEGVPARVDYPASSPYVLGCGGTSLKRTDGGIHEVVWGDGATGTGGGVSECYPLPSWQEKAGVPASMNPSGFRGRGVPDVAGNADGHTGYRVYHGGRTHVQGGTSAVAPLWAALIAQVNQSLGTRVGYLNPLLYETIAPAGFNTVVHGTNGGYSAGFGWDPCTGHGTPDGTRLLDALRKRG